MIMDDMARKKGERKFKGTYDNNRNFVIIIYKSQTFYCFQNLLVVESIYNQVDDDK